MTHPAISSAQDRWPKTLADVLKWKGYRRVKDTWERRERPEWGQDHAIVTVRAAPSRGYVYCLTYSPDTAEEDSHDFWSADDLADYLWSLRRFRQG